MIYINSTQPTTVILQEILIAFSLDQRVILVTERGKGRDLIQRIRVRRSRAIQKLLSMNMSPKFFVLRTVVKPWTGIDGVRQDAVIVWKEETPTHIATNRFLQEQINGKVE